MIVYRCLSSFSSSSIDLIRNGISVAFYLTLILSLLRSLANFPPPSDDRYYAIEMNGDSSI